MALDDNPLQRDDGPKPRYGINKQDWIAHDADLEDEVRELAEALHPQLRAQFETSKPYTVKREEAPAPTPAEQECRLRTFAKPARPWVKLLVWIVIVLASIGLWGIIIWRCAT